MNDRILSSTRTQPESTFSSSDARAAGFIPIPLALARTLGAPAQTIGAMLSAWRQDGKTTQRVQAGLAKLAGVTDRTFRRHLRILESAGLLSTIGEIRQPNRHKLLKPEPEVVGEWLPLPRYAMKLPWACRLVYAYVVYRSELAECQNACNDGLRAISRALGIDRRNVRDAVARLVAEGYLDHTDGDPTALWLRPPPEAPGVICPEPRGLSVREGGGNLSGKKEMVLRSGSKNHTKVVSSGKLSKITEADLADDASLAGIFMKSVRIGLIPDSGQSRLRVWTAATHALRVADSPPAMFAWIVSGGHWGHATAADEDVALDRLKGIGPG